MNEPYIDHAGWVKYQLMREANPTAAEKGRLAAAANIANDPEARARVEAAYGVENCKQMYPEAYGRPGRFTGMFRLLDRIKRALPW